MITRLTSRATSEGEKRGRQKRNYKLIIGVLSVKLKIVVEMDWITILTTFSFVVSPGPLL